MRNVISPAIVGLLMAAAAVAQTPAARPAYIMGGVSYTQAKGAAGFVSGIMPEGSGSLGIYGSVTTDLVPIKATINGKSVYLISGSVRAGQHKLIHRDQKNMLLMGGDAGASFANAAGGGMTVGLSGSVTVTYVREINQHWAIALPLRMLYMSNVGPNGTGAWNPVAEFGIVWKP